MLRRSLLACGILASLLYVATDVVAAIRYPAYHSFTTRAVSELMASGAPSERLVDPLFLLYGALMIAFGIGICASGTAKRMHLTGVLLIVYAAIGFLGPTVFEMNVRGSGGPPSADILHIALTGVLVLFIFATVTAGAALRGRAFRIYSHATLVTMLAFGIATAFAMRGIDTGRDTSWAGLAERINIGAFLLWVMVLAIALFRAHSPATSMQRS